MPRHRSRFKSGSKFRPQAGHFILFLSLASVVVSGIMIWSIVGFFREEFPDVSLLKTHYPVVHYNGPEEDPDVTLQRSRPNTWVNLNEISKPALSAVVISEDWAFYQHKGYDANQLKEAIKTDISEGRFARGAGTITMQVIRNVFLTRDKNLWRKLKEFILAVQLEKGTSKRKILETYMNIVEWGAGIYGIQRASFHYFGKPPSELTAKEGAFLAMLLPSPKRYAQSFKQRQLTAYARNTIEDILSKMEQAHSISEEERQQAVATPLSFEQRPATAL